MTNTKTKQEEVSDQIAVIIWFITVFPMFLWRGFVLKTVWNWIIPVVLVGVHPIGLAGAIGLMIVVSWLLQWIKNHVDKDLSVTTKVYGMIFSDLLGGGLTILIAYLVHLAL